MDIWEKWTNLTLKYINFASDLFLTTNSRITVIKILWLFRQKKWLSKEYEWLKKKSIGHYKNNT